MKHDKDHDVCKDATFIQWDHYSKLSLQALRVAMATKGRILLLLLFEKRLTSASLAGTSNSVDYKAVEKEILKVMVDSQSFWPGETIFFIFYVFFVTILILMKSSIAQLTMATTDLFLFALLGIWPDLTGNRKSCFPSEWSRGAKELIHDIQGRIYELV